MSADPTRFRLVPGSQRADHARADSGRSKSFAITQPIEADMETFPLLPWEQPALTPTAADARGRGASPWPNARMATSDPRAAADAAAEYAKEATQDLPAALRERLLRGIGMFDFPVGELDVDDLR